MACPWCRGRPESSARRRGPAGSIARPPARPRCRPPPARSPWPWATGRTARSARRPAACAARPATGSRRRRVR
ncbi:hypothetical protein F0L68_18185 [Solihabitans fulvus]|uniref:Uncharacterized protein n=1 Tax=Solihabitans fulvus TaxID=1892852 RepID=A0A5B2XDX7_9PSEU|nr:hypothetical protein F0L68_18185 [Solihabitans fulvus]